MRRTPRTGRKRAHLSTEPGWYGGYEVLDPLIQKIGRPQKLFVNGDGHPGYLRVRLGLLPVQEVGVDDERRTLVLG